MNDASTPARTPPGPPAPGDGLAAATVAVIAGRPPATPNAGLNAPLVLASTYVSSPGAPQPGDLGYGRWGNPTWQAFEVALGALEGGSALLFASGMAAVAAVVDRVPDGGRVVVPDGAYNGTLALLRELAGRGRVDLVPVPISDTDAVRAALAPGAHLLWVESPTNPLLEVADLPALVGAGHAADALVAVDNTFATPLLQTPLAFGADLVVHSVTKYLSGHSDVLLGAIVTRDPALAERLLTHRTTHGGIPGTVEAWLALRGLRTLHLRVERAGRNAAELARRLSGHPAVARVRHPSLPSDPGHARATAQMRGHGAIVAVELAGGAAAAEELAATVRLWIHTTSLGGVESTLERRRRHPGEPDVVPENLVRLSVGVEDVEDLWADLARVLDQLVLRETS
ncbi:MAG: trans-sulfuration enzyme family protein [Kineosporiaceae bacterium]